MVDVAANDVVVSIESSVSVVVDKIAVVDLCVVGVHPPLTCKVKVNIGTNICTMEPCLTYYIPFKSSF